MTGIGTDSSKRRGGGREGKAEKKREKGGEGNSEEKNKSVVETIGWGKLGLSVEFRPSEWR